MPWKKQWTSISLVVSNSRECNMIVSITSICNKKVSLKCCKSGIKGVVFRRKVYRLISGTEFAAVWTDIEVVLLMTTLMLLRKYIGFSVSKTNPICYSPPKYGFHPNILCNYLYCLLCWTYMYQHSFRKILNYSCHGNTGNKYGTVKKLLVLLSNT